MDLQHWAATWCNIQPMGGFHDAKRRDWLIGALGNIARNADAGGENSGLRHWATTWFNIQPIRWFRATAGRELTDCCTGQHCGVVSNHWESSMNLQERTDGVQHWKHFRTVWSGLPHFLSFFTSYRVKVYLVIDYFEMSQLIYSDLVSP